MWGVRPKSNEAQSGLEKIKEKWGGFRTKLWKFIVRKAVWIVSFFALLFLLLVFCFMDYSPIGDIVVIMGIIVSFLGTMVLAIPSTPVLRRKSVSYKFLNRVQPAYSSFREFEEVDDGDNGFRELVIMIQEFCDEELTDVDEISPHGNHFPVRSKINGEVYDFGMEEYDYMKKQIIDSLEITCYNSGVKILLIGFFIQMAGSVHVVMVS